MTSVPQKILNLPLEQRALLALKAAVKKAIAERTREGLPVYVWSDGNVVDLSANKSHTSSRRPSKRAKQPQKAQAKAQPALSRMRKQAARRGLARRSHAAINSEIRAVRSKRKSA